ncbi:TonB-dependent receptor [Marinomonas sp.]|nr:TonB-dependent receptor [Marinomonas sp.]MDB4837151.1 TonB-dependent receptor [Marinomonas sp.]
MQFKKKELALLACSCLVASAPVYAENDASVELDSLIISAKAPVDEASFSGSVTVVTADEIAASGAVNLKDVLATTPGVQMVMSGANPTLSPVVRGQDAERVLILINGKRIPDTDRNIPFSPALRYGMVPLSNIERVEIIRGPASSLYGADALAGVINVITNEATLDWTGSISLYTEKTESVDGGDSQGLSLSASGAVSESVDLAIAAESSDKDAVIGDDDVTSISSERDITNYQVDLGVDFDSGDRMEVSVINSDSFTSGYDSSGDQDEPTDADSQLYNITYLTELSGFDTSLSVTSGVSDVLEGEDVWEIEERDISLDSQGQLNESHYLSFGANYREEGVKRDDDSVSDFDEEVSAVNLQFQDLMKLGEDTDLTLGFTYDDHSKYDAEISPKASIVNQLTPVVALKASYGESYLAPSLRESSSEYVVGSSYWYYIGNDDLQPETAKTSEVGFIIQHPNSLGSITLFRSDVDDLISTVRTSVGVGTQNEYTNVDSAVLQGVEVSWSFFNDIGSQKLNMSYTFLDTEDESTGKELTERARHLAKVNYFHQDALLGFDMDAAARYTGTQFTDEDNTETVGAYFVADLGISKEVFENTTVRFGINNLTDEIVLDDDDQLLESGRSYKLSLTSSF